MITIYEFSRFLNYIVWGDYLFSILLSSSLIVIVACSSACLKSKNLNDSDTWAVFQFENEGM